MAVRKSRAALWLALPVLTAAVLTIEVVLAQRAPRLPSAEPFDLRRISVEPEATRVVWLGDSTAAGVGASDADHALSTQVMNAAGATDVTVLAVSGARADDVAERQAPQLTALDPDLVFVSVGANDVTHLTGRHDFRLSYERIFSSIPPHAHVVLLGVPDMGAPIRLAQPLRVIAGERGRMLDDIVFGLAEDHGASYVDIAAATGPAFRSDPHRFFAADEFHPGDDGYRLWADAVKATLNTPRAVNPGQS